MIKQNIIKSIYKKINIDKKNSLIWRYIKTSTWLRNLFLALSFAVLNIFSVWILLNIWSIKSTSGENFLTTDKSLELLRNFFLMAGSLIIGGNGFLLAVMRTGAARTQTALSRQSHLNDRFQKAADMLGSNIMMVRIAGLQTLDDLINEDEKNSTTAAPG